MARESAYSFSGMPQCAGTHCRWVCRPRSASDSRSSHIATPSPEVCAAGPPSSSSSAAVESRQATTGSAASGPSSPRTAASAARRATSYACVLEHSRPAGTLISLFSPPGSRIRAPPPPIETPQSAEPSDQTQMAEFGDGRESNLFSAAERRDSSEAHLEQSSMQGEMVT